MKLLETLEEQILILDGGMGTEILKRTGRSFDCPELMNLEHSEVVLDIHRAYRDAGADILETNTLGANRIKLAEFNASDRVQDINCRAVDLAKKAAGNSSIFIAGSIGPMGTLIHPLGDIRVQEAFEVFSEQARALEQGGADFLLIETQIDIHEAQTALRAAREATSLPIAVSMTFPQEDGRTVTGSDPETAAVTFAAADADIYAINCGGHPKKIEQLLERTRLYTHKPLAVYANAGEPQKRGDRTFFPLGPEAFLAFAEQYYKMGAHIIGGCCGTTPEYIRQIARSLKGKKPVLKPERASGFRASSRHKILHLGDGLPFRVVGENINPYARKKLAGELKEGHLGLARKYARIQEKAGADALDINLGKRAEKEPEFYADGVAELQQSSSLPFLLDNRSPPALEKALRCYAGKAVINSVTAEKESYERLLPLAKKYGAGVVLLPLDKDGIPNTARKRLQLIQSLVAHALEIGLRREDLVADPVVLALSATQTAAYITLDTIELIDSLHMPTIMGLSNISFGLPRRRLINSSFLCMARQRGLDSAMLNPLDDNLMSVICAGDALTQQDPGLKQYLARFSGSSEESEEIRIPQPANPQEALFQAILEGSKLEVEPLIQTLIAQGKEGFAILQEILSPALKKAGEFYEQNIYFLPQLIQAAEAMETASRILENTYQVKEKAEKKALVVLATVRGDLHDIGKNIVHLVLRNSGFEVLDLGKNTDAQTILETARRRNAAVIGLSSLMTTTMDEMQTVVGLRDAQAPDIKIILGGAAVSREYTRDIGADAYGKDAMDAVRQIKIISGKSP